MHTDIACNQLWFVIVSRNTYLLFANVILVVWFWGKIASLISAEMFGAFLFTCLKVPVASQFFDVM